MPLAVESSSKLQLQHSKNNAQIITNASRGGIVPVNSCSNTLIQRPDWKAWNQSECLKTLQAPKGLHLQDYNAMPSLEAPSPRASQAQQFQGTWVPKSSRHSRSQNARHRNFPTNLVQAVKSLQTCRSQKMRVRKDAAGFDAMQSLQAWDAAAEPGCMLQGGRPPLLLSGHHLLDLQQDPLQGRQTE